MRLICSLLPPLAALPAQALASPGRGDDADGATVERGAIDSSLIYDRLTGGPQDGVDLLQIGATYGATDRLRLGMQASFEREPGSARRVDTVGAEALLNVGRVGPFDIAVYGTYDIGIDSPDTIEGRVILEHSKGPFALRINLIGTKDLGAGQSLELGYAIAADIEAAPRLRLGVQGFGEFGTFDRLLPHGGHAFGPVATYRLNEGINLRCGYLFTIGKARDDADGQLRLGLEFGF